MAGNTTPIASRVGVNGWSIGDGNAGTTGPIKTANTAKDGTGVVTTIFTADATNGGRVERVRARACGTNTASVLRVFINNGTSMVAVTGVSVASGANPLFTATTGGVTTNGVYGHGLVVGSVITVSGMSGAGSTVANATWTVTAVPSVTTFQVGTGLTTSGAGSGATATPTSANNTLWAEATLPATTLSEVAALANVEIPNTATVPDATGFPLVLAPGNKLNVTLGTTVAAGYFVSAVGGAY